MQHFELSQLRSRITGRTLVLLVACGVAPVIVVAGGAYMAVSKSVANVAGEQIVAASEASASAMSTRLQRLTATLRGPIDSIPLDRGGPLPAFSAGESHGAFDAVLIEAAADKITRAIGTMPSRPEVTSEQTEILRKGLPVMIMAEPAATKMVFVVMPTGKPGTDFPRVWAHGTVGNILADMAGPAPKTGFCLYAASKPLYCRGAADSVPFADASRSATGVVRWPSTAGAILAGYSALPRAETFGSPPWYVGQSMSESAMLAPLAALRNVALFGTLLAAAFMVALSQYVARRRALPLAGLITASEQLRNGDYSARIETTGVDEFESLTDSVNQLATELDRRFKGLDTLQQLDDAVLDARSADAIAATVLRGAPTLLNATSIAVVTASADDQMHWHGQVAAEDRAIREKIDVTVSRSVFAALRQSPECMIVAPGEELPVYCAALRPVAGSTVLIFPLLRGGRPFGVLASALKPGTLANPRITGAGRQIANQLARGLSNVAMFTDLDAVGHGALTILANSIDSASKWTAGHSERVAKIAAELAKRVGLDEPSQTLAFRGAMLHDIGKLGVPTAILDKPGQLNEEELSTIEAHAMYGANMLRDIAIFKDVVPLVQHHHEFLDGSGYPHGLRAENISPIIRVLTVADVYDALLSDRPYREGLTPAGALGILRRGAGVKFDARVVDALEAMIKEDAPNGDLGSLPMDTIGDAELSMLLAEVH